MPRMDENKVYRVNAKRTRVDYVGDDGYVDVRRFPSSAETEEFVHRLVADGFVEFSIE